MHFHYICSYYIRTYSTPVLVEMGINSEGDALFPKMKELHSFKDEASSIDRPRQTTPRIMHGHVIWRDSALDNVNETPSIGSLSYTPVSQKDPYDLGGYPRPVHAKIAIPSADMMRNSYSRSGNQCGFPAIHQAHI